MTVEWGWGIQVPRTRIPLWQAIKNIYNEYQDEYVTRAHLLDRLRLDGYHISTTVDTYKNYLVQAGYLQKAGRGRVLVVQAIPVDLTTNDVKNQAYGGGRIGRILGPKEVYQERETKKRVAKLNEFLSEEEMFI